MTGRITFCMAAALAVAATTGPRGSVEADGSGDPAKRPTAVILPNDTAGYVLTADGSLTSFAEADGRASGLAFRIGEPYDVLDAAATRGAGAARVGFVVYRSLGGRRDSWLVVWTQGQAQGHWISLMGPGVYGGVGMEPDGSRAYVTNANTADVYSVTTLGKNSKVEFLAGIPTTGRIGTIAVDPQGHRLFVAELDVGTVYEVNIQTRKASRLISVNGGEIRAMFYDGGRRRLYLADASNEMVWAVDLDRAVPKAREFAYDPAFKTPNGIAIDARSQVWVCDERAGKLFRFGIDGGRKAEMSVDWRASH